MAVEVAEARMIEAEENAAEGRRIMDERRA